MQINASHPWLIQPGQLELTGTEACLIYGWFYILREELVGFLWFLFVLFVFWDLFSFCWFFVFWLFFFNLTLSYFQSI